MLDIINIKALVKQSGADLCGIAPIERFDAAPAGFHPRDIDPKTESVIVIARRLPSTCLRVPNRITYTHCNNIVTLEADRTTFLLALQLEEEGISALPIPSDDPYEHWEVDRSYGRAILSMRHAGLLAGLGVLGRNTLLINSRLGNMMQLGAVLTSLKLEGDPLATYRACPPHCSLCIEGCPAGALNGVTVDQAKCRPHSIITNSRGFTLKGCNTCRSVCPHALGIRKVD